ncbi:hypothetical protein [Salinibacterium sp. TMP30]|uniref:hypothetical protein n=1 Tax=Salinibacterium sp. TMP30 TaxID=3138237 RepID=UPI0031390A6D
MKTDFTKTLDSYAARHNQFRIVDAPPLHYLMVDGHGAPGGDSEYPDALATLHEEFIPKQGLRMTGKHHEIYFNDFRKVEASKLRTILRQPVERI